MIGNKETKLVIVFFGQDFISFLENPPSIVKTILLLRRFNDHLLSPSSKGQQILSLSRNLHSLGPSIRYHSCATQVVDPCPPTVFVPSSGSHRTSKRFRPDVEDLSRRYDLSSLSSHVLLAVFLRLDVDFRPYKDIYML